MAESCSIRGWVEAEVGVPLAALLDAARALRATEALEEDLCTPWLLSSLEEEKKPLFAPLELLLGKRGRVVEEEEEGEEAVREGTSPKLKKPFELEFPAEEGGKGI